MDIIEADKLRVIQIQLECNIPDEATIIQKYKATWALFFKFLKMECYLMRQMIPKVDVKGMIVSNYKRVTLFNKTVFLFVMALINQEINKKKNEMNEIYLMIYSIFTKIVNYPRVLFFNLFHKPALERAQSVTKLRHTSRKQIYDNKFSRATDDDVFEILNDDDDDSLLGSISERGSAISLDRVAALESEIDSLKRQLAVVMNAVSSSNIPIQQIASNTTSAATLVPPNYSSNNEANVSISSSSTTSFKAPPPPPPPPPSNLFQKVKSEKTSIRKNSCATPKAGGDISRPVSMNDVLKELNSVKLRSVSKSTDSLNQRSTNDIEGFFNKALENKFKNTGINESLDTSTECVEWGDEN